MQQKKLTQNLNKKKIYFYIVLIFISSIFFNFYSGYRGIFPLDSFAIYDGGYKVFNGFHPFKDYWSITGPLLDYLQYFFFKLFGINWFSYVLHSTTLNILVSVTLFYLLLILGLEKIYCFFYAFCCSILAYPSAGTPFMDHHAVFFSLISVMFLLLSIKKNQGRFWFLVPIFLFASFLSKQIPSTYFLILFTITFFLVIFLLQKKNFRFLLFLILGGIIPLLITISFFIINGIPFKNFLVQYIFYPYEIGIERNSKISLDLNNIILRFKFIYLSLIPLFIVFFNLIKKKLFLKNEIKKDLLIIGLTCISTLIFIYTQILTKNQILIFSLIPFCLGISHFYIQKYYNKKIIINLILILLIFSTFKYHLRFNENKKFMEFRNTNFNLAVDAKILDESIKGLNWISPKYQDNPTYEIKLLKQIKEKIILDSTNKIIISDYQILPSVTKIKNTAPNKWFDELSVPNKDNKFFSLYKEFFTRKLIQQNIQALYIIGEKDFFLKDIFRQGCSKKERINEIASKINIEKCLH